MLRKLLMLTTIVLVFSACELQATVIRSEWLGGRMGAWGEASNWSPSIVPNNGVSRTFAVTINSGSGRVDIGLQQTRTIGQLDCYGEVELERWAQDWIALVCENDLTNYGHLEITINRLQIEGNLYNLAGGTLIINGEVTVRGGSLENSGTITVRNRHCGADGTFVNNISGQIEGIGAVWTGESFRNMGKIYALGWGLALISNGTLINNGIVGNRPNASLYIETMEDVNNHGMVEANAGGGVTFARNLVNESDGTIRLLGGTLAAQTITQTADANFAGFGGITGDVVIVPNGIIKLTGPTNIVGDVNIPAGATLEISNGQTLIVGHTANNGVIRVVNGNVVFLGGYSGNGVVDKN